MHATDAVKFSNVSAATGQFSLIGGVYLLVAVSAAWGGGSVLLEFLAPDGSTWVDGGAAISANGAVGTGGGLQLNAGAYRFNVTGTPGANLVLCSIPSQ